MPQKREWYWILGIALTSFVFLLLSARFAPQGTTAVVAQNGQVIARMPLAQEGVLSLPGNTVTVESGKVSMTQADCPDLSCVRQGSITKAGQSIICLPHRVLITIEGPPDPAQVDSITY